MAELACCARTVDGAVRIPRILKILRTLKVLIFLFFILEAGCGCISNLVLIVTSGLGTTYGDAIANVSIFGVGSGGGREESLGNLGST